MSGILFKDLAGHTRKLGPQLSFDRPELSPLLAEIKSKSDRQEIIEILLEGQKRLTATRRADMPGFIPCPEHQEKLDLYNQGRFQRFSIYDLISKGEKVYDK